MKVDKKEEIFVYFKKYQTTSRPDYGDWLFKTLSNASPEEINRIHTKMLTVKHNRGLIEFLTKNNKGKI